MLTFRQYIQLQEEFRIIPGTQGGSNPGGKAIDTETGKHHYVKFYKNPDQGKSEVLAAKIYQHMGIHTLDPEHHHVDGKHGVATPWRNDLAPMSRHELMNVSHPQAQQLGKMYHAAVLTKNWDIVGLEHDNIMRHKKNNNLHAIDTGGVFNFRAQGGHKDFGHDIAEHKSLRNPDLPSGEVFNNAFKKYPDAEKHGLEAVKKIDDTHIHNLFKDSGIKNWKELHKAFSARKSALINHYEKVK